MSKQGHRKDAKDKINNLLKAGKLTKGGQCQMCGKHTEVQGHHADYKKTEEAIWVCRKCHALADRRRKEEDSPRVKYTGLDINVQIPEVAIKVG